MPLIEAPNDAPTSVADLLWQITDVLRDSLSREAEAVLEASDNQDSMAANEHRQKVKAYNQLIVLLAKTASRANEIEAKTGPLGFFDISPVKH